MDPIQALIDADQAISDLEYARAIELLQAYGTWRLGGGYEPTAGQLYDRGLSRRPGDQYWQSLMLRTADRLPQVSA